MSARHGFRGYVTSRGFGSYNIPVPVQSLVLRDYCARKGLLYVLPVNENVFPSSYMVLEGLIADLSGFEGVVTCSMHMLPRRAERRERIYRRVLEQQCSLHLVLEDLVVDSPERADRIEELLLFSQLASQAPKPAALG